MAGEGVESLIRDGILHGQLHYHHLRVHNPQTKPSIQLTVAFQILLAQGIPKLAMKEGASFVTQFILLASR